MKTDYFRDSSTNHLCSDVVLIQRKGPFRASRLGQCSTLLLINHSDIEVPESNYPHTYKQKVKIMEIVSYDSRRFC